MPSARQLIASASLASILLALATPSSAQTIERNTPLIATTSGSAVTLAGTTVEDADNSPLGVNVAGIRLIGAIEAVDESGSGISIGTIAVGEDPLLNTALAAAIRGKLEGFIGRPLSMRLIADAQAAIAAVYREAGFPFVSVTIPPQEVTGGVLNLRVIEFVYGAVVVKGADDGEGARILSRIRHDEGERIDLERLNEDLEWINRYAYARATATFAPGDELGRSNLTIELSQSKPFSVYAGYSNTGTPATGLDRFFAGFGLGIAPLNNTTVSYQVTASPDVVAEPSKLLPGVTRGRYVSHAGTVIVPTLPRQQLEFAPNFVATQQQSGFVTFNNDVIELPITYRTAVSNIVPGLHAGDVHFSVEMKRLMRDTLFGGAVVGSATADVLQFVLGWSHTMTDDSGETVVGIEFIANPGGVLPNNTNIAWNAFSNGRVTDMSYAYAGIDLRRQTELNETVTLVNRLIGQVAVQPLPDTEQFALGGLDATRGYGLETASVDAGLILRNELRFDLASMAPALGVEISPFIFLDSGYGVDLSTNKSSTLAGTGIGADLRLGPHASISTTGAIALLDAGTTKAGDIDMRVKATAAY